MSPLNIPTEGVKIPNLSRISDAVVQKHSKVLKTFTIQLADGTDVNKVFSQDGIINVNLLKSVCQPRCIRPRHAVANACRPSS